jgi:hypothetical protein
MINLCSITLDQDFMFSDCLKTSGTHTLLTCKLLAELDIRIGKPPCHIYIP